MYHTELGRFVSRDPIEYPSGDDTNLYRYVENSPTGRVDPSGTAPFDAVRKWWNNGRLPKAWGIDVTGSVVVGTGGAFALQAVFFGDTCEFGFYGVGPAAAKDPEELRNLQPGAEKVKQVLSRFVFGLAWGWDVSISGNITVAEYSGSGAADAESWAGVFYGGTFGGSLLGKAGVGGLVGEDIKKGDWVGLNAGVGLAATPGPNVKINPQGYHLLTWLRLREVLGDRLGNCVCYALIRKLP